MNFKPMTDAEIEMANIIPEGTECDAEVVKSEAYVSQSSGKETIRLILNVFHGEITNQVYCYLTPNFPFLFKHAIIAMLSDAEYQAGEISPAIFEYKTCRVVVGLDEYKGRKKNIVMDFKRRPADAAPLPSGDNLPW